MSDAPQTRRPRMEFAATALAIFGGLAVATALFEIYIVTLFPRAGADGDFTRHVLGEAGALIGFGAAALSLAYGPFREGRRSAWWTVTLGGGAFVALYAWGQFASGTPNPGLLGSFAGLWLVAVAAAGPTALRG